MTIGPLEGEIEPGSSAALLIWEDTWAAPLADALREAGGVASN